MFASAARLRGRFIALGDSDTIRHRSSAKAHRIASNAVDEAPPSCSRHCTNPFRRTLDVEVEVSGTCKASRSLKPKQVIGPVYNRNTLRSGLLQYLEIRVKRTEVRHDAGLARGPPIHATSLAKSHEPTPFAFDTVEPAFGEASPPASIEIP